MGFVANRKEEGSGTIMGAGLALVLITLTVAVLVVVQVVVGAGRAASAADLAALAAADAARGLTSGRPCDVAAAVADRNDVDLDSCQVVGGGVIVDVTTSVDLPRPWGEATGRSRAGPPQD